MSVAALLNSTSVDGAHRLLDAASPMQCGTPPTPHVIATALVLTHGALYKTQKTLCHKGSAWTERNHERQSTFQRQGLLRLATLGTAVTAAVAAAVLVFQSPVAQADSAPAAPPAMGMAQKAWFPAVTLMGNAGHASPELGDLFK